MIGLVTIGQSPRSDVVPEMAVVMGPGIAVREAGALDGLSRTAIEALAPAAGDEILITRLADGSPVFLGKEKIVGLVETRIAALEREGAALTALLCTGAFPRLRASRPLIQPHPVLLRHAAQAVLAGPARRPHAVGPARAADRSAMATRRVRTSGDAAVALRRRGSRGAPTRVRSDACRRSRARGDGLHGLSPQDARRAARADRRARAPRQSPCRPCHHRALPRLRRIL